MRKATKNSYYTLSITIEFHVASILAQNVRSTRLFYVHQTLTIQVIQVHTYSRTVNAEIARERERH